MTRGATRTEVILQFGKQENYNKNNRIISFSSVFRSPRRRLRPAPRLELLLRRAGRRLLRQAHLLEMRRRRFHAAILHCRRVHQHLFSPTGGGQVILQGESLSRIRRKQVQGKFIPDRKFRNGKSANFPLFLWQCHSGFFPFVLRAGPFPAVGGGNDRTWMPLQDRLHLGPDRGPLRGEEEVQEWGRSGGRRREGELLPDTGRMHEVVRAHQGEKVRIKNMLRQKISKNH